MKTIALLLAMAAFAFAGCGSDDGTEPSDFETIEKASDISAQASDQADLAIEALGKGYIETASTHVDEATDLARQAQETLESVESVPTRTVFANINRLTLEGYEILSQGIDAAGRGDDTATERYIQMSLDLRKRKLRLFNQTDFEAIGAGESNEKFREALKEQIQSEIGQ